MNRSASEATGSYEGMSFTEFSANDVNNRLGGLEDEGLVNFDDGVELSDVAKSYREMLTSLDQFKEQK